MQTIDAGDLPSWIDCIGPGVGLVINAAGASMSTIWPPGSRREAASSARAWICPIAKLRDRAHRWQKARW